MNQKKGRLRGKRLFSEDQEAYLRYLTQERWERIKDLWEEAAAEDERAAALLELAEFPERRRYQEIWTRNWEGFSKEAVVVGEAGTVFGLLERMVWRSFEQEEAARRAEGMRSAFEEDDYFQFMAFRTGRLYEADPWEVGGFAEGPGEQG
jgi:hypothetical protein